MTTPSREEAPELKACPFCGSRAECVANSSSPLDPMSMAQCVTCGATAYWRKWNQRADLVNREPSEGDVERVMRAIYGPDLDCEPAESGIEHGIFRRAAIRAINAWRNP